MKKGLIVGLMMIGLISCGEKKEEKVETKPKKHVVATRVVKEEISDRYYTDGVIVPQEKVAHSLDTKGTVQAVLKKNGDRVKKGEVVAKFKDATLESAYFSAKTKYELAKSNFEKFGDLYKKDMISQVEYFNYKDTYANALSNYSSKKSEFEKLARKAELDGVIGNLDLKVGNIIPANTDIFTVVNTDKMEVTVDFPGNWLNQLGIGAKVEVSVTDLNNKKFVGTVKSIDPIADPQTKKFPVKISIANPNGELKDGMYSQVVIPTDKREGVIVPQDAVFIKDLLSYVYKIENGKVTRVEVTTGAEEGTNVEIVSGELQVGDLVVSEGIFGLSDGDEIIINKENN